jgi:3-deoxy-D-manno-octulosonate 8-phosphate phosphatase KdsC-like HAD superfamily phosphatase
MATEAAPRAPLNRHNKEEGDISSTFTTFSGRKAEPLPSRFKDLKHRLVAGFEEDIQKSWDDLVKDLKVRTEEVATQREKVGGYAGRAPLL